MEKFIVSRDDSIYEAFPDVVLAADGTLVCVFTECTHHCDRTGARLCLCRSRDRGRTWTPKEYLTEPGANDGNYNCARLSRLSDGRLILVCDFITEAGKSDTAIVRMWQSADNGQSWNGPVDTPARGIVPDKLTELDTGRWLLAAHTESKEHGKLTEYLWYSDDKGQSWSDRITVATDPHYELCESSMLPLGDGTVVCFLRENSGCGWDGMKTISHDNGETWEGPYNVPVPGMHRPTVGRLTDGRYLLTCRLHQGYCGSWGAYQLTLGGVMTCDTVLATSRCLQRVRLFPVDFDRSPQSDTGYTGWVQWDDGEILIVNYIMDDAPKAWIRATVLRIEEVVL